jgi:hypothetical protein
MSPGSSRLVTPADTRSKLSRLPVALPWASRKRSLGSVIATSLRVGSGTRSPRSLSVAGCRKGGRTDGASSRRSSVKPLAG